MGWFEHRLFQSDYDCQAEDRRLWWVCLTVLSHRSQVQNVNLRACGNSRFEDITTNSSNYCATRGTCSSWLRPSLVRNLYSFGIKPHPPGNISAFQDQCPIYTQNVPVAHDLILWLELGLTEIYVDKPGRSHTLTS